MSKKWEIYKTDEEKVNEISEKYSLDLSDIKKIEKAMKIEAF